MVNRILRASWKLCLLASAGFASLGVLSLSLSAPVLAEAAPPVCTGCPVSCVNSPPGTSCYTPGYNNCQSTCTCQNKKCQ